MTDSSSQFPTSGEEPNRFAGPCLRRETVWIAVFIFASSPLIQAQDKNAKIHIDRTDQRLEMDITSPFGIGKTAVPREQPQWPKKVLLRLHLKGLESLKVRRGEICLEWSAAPTLETATRVTLWTGAKETVLNQSDPLYTEVRFVKNKKKGETGYFEVTIPPKLLETNPSELRVEWIDFYRS